MDCKAEKVEREVRGGNGLNVRVCEYEEGGRVFRSFKFEHIGEKGSAEQFENMIRERKDFSIISGIENAPPGPDTQSRKRTTDSPKPRKAGVTESNDTTLNLLSPSVSAKNQRTLARSPIARVMKQRRVEEEERRDMLNEERRRIEQRDAKPTPQKEPSSRSNRTLSEIDDRYDLSDLKKVIMALHDKVEKLQSSHLAMLAVLPDTLRARASENQAVQKKLNEAALAVQRAVISYKSCTILAGEDSFPSCHRSVPEMERMAELMRTRRT